MKILPVGAELFHLGGRTDRQTHVTKPVFAFRNFANVPKAEHYCAHRAQQCKDYSFRSAQYCLSDRQLPAARSVAGRPWPATVVSRTVITM